MRVKLSNVRFSFLNAYTPRVGKGKPEVNEKGEDVRKFSVSTILERDSAEHKAMTAAIEAAAKEQWGDKAEGVLKGLYAADRVCLKEGNRRLDEDGNVLPGYEDRMFVNANSVASKPPVVFNRFAQKITAETRGMFQGEQRGPLSGDYGQAMIDVWAMDNQHGRRICATLLGVALKKFGEPLGRREMSEDDIRNEFDFDEPMGVLEE